MEPEPGQSDGSGSSQIPRLRAAPSGSGSETLVPVPRLQVQIRIPIRTNYSDPDLQQYGTCYLVNKPTTLKGVKNNSKIKKKITQVNTEIKG